MFKHMPVCAPAGRDAANGLRHEPGGQWRPGQRRQPTAALPHARRGGRDQSPPDLTPRRKRRWTRLRLSQCRGAAAPCGTPALGGAASRGSRGRHQTGGLPRAQSHQLNVTALLCSDCSLKQPGCKPHRYCMPSCHSPPASTLRAERRKRVSLASGGRQWASASGKRKQPLTCIAFKIHVSAIEPKRPHERRHGGHVEGAPVWVCGA